MDTRARIIDVAGKLVLCWFLFESIWYLASGRFLDLARMIPQFFQNRPTLGLYVVYHLAIATAGVLAAVPLLLQGRTAGLVLGIAVRLSGHTVSPLAFVLPPGALLSAHNEPTVLNHAIDILWLVVTLLTVILFFLQRRILRNT